MYMMRSLPDLRTIRAFAFALCLFASVGLSPAHAQDDDTAPDPALPEIAPREIEIRGELDIAFPSLERQPLVGFNPPPLIPEPVANRRPFVDDYKQERADLPQSIPEPEISSASLQRPALPLTGLISGGGGRYLTRFANGHLRVPLSNSETVTLGVRYRGSDGFQPYDDFEDVETPYDFVNGTFGFETRQNTYAVGFDLEGYLNQYTLYGAEANPSRPVLDRPDREGQFAQGGVTFDTFGSFPLMVRGTFSQTTYESEIFVDAPDGPLDITEQRLHITANSRIPFDNRAVLIDGLFETAGFDDAGAFEANALLYSASLSGIVVSQPNLTVRLGARVLGIGADRADGDRRDATYISPVGRVEFDLQPGVSLYAQNTPRVVAHPVHELFQDNPYLLPRPDVQPSLIPFNAEGGLRIRTRPVELKAFGGYVQASDYMYMQAANVTAYESGFFNTFYDSARILRVGGEVALQGLDDVQVSLGVTYRDGQLTDVDTAIPYFAPLTARGLVSYAFDDGRGLVQLTGRLEGERYTDTSESEQLGTYADLDLEASYDFSNALGVMVLVQNMTSGSLERWQNYPQPPLIVTSGLRVRW